MAVDGEYNGEHSGAHDGGRGPDQEASLAPAPMAGTEAGPPAGRGRGLRLPRGRRSPGPRGGTGREPHEPGRVKAFLGVVADRIIELAPRIPVRDLDTLRRQFPGLGPEELADRLISGAVKGSAAVGAGVGASAMLPVPPAMPAELTAEVVGVASVELKLIAELYEVYGRRPPGNARERAAVYLTAWTDERGVELTSVASLNAAFGSQLRRQLRQRLLRRTLRNFPNLAPFMIGAVAGALMNRRETRKLAERIRGDLRKRQVPWDVLPAPEAGGHRALEAGD
ncbi:hypothetical protein V1L54_16245 [Streptomyces sp. TRM 70361]|uniref:hypothetical protein n=1 Tax=Streptomyces sp. TRM 70361 TaxID=3116553 RepID=UPI002E7C498F|nr:hypothetical protein [Streptomyces sp. TRM 70361]MEE1940938.1 hypothetical protein [Streptomyces sp. TRM 70361]